MALDRIFKYFCIKLIILKDHFEDPGLLITQQTIEGSVSWRSPSNIALVKYWGKYGTQLPKNPSISFSLTDSFTETTICYKTSQGNPKREFLFENENNPSFADRIWKFIDSLESIYPYLSQLDLRIQTHNSFPHSAGIASSASSMSALALCLVDMEKEIFGSPKTEEEFLQKASYLARLGSGSASRSVYPSFALWGMAKQVDTNSENKYAIPLNQNIHPVFQQLRDTILIIDGGEKKVSSSAGHQLMDNHPFADDRLAQANKNIIDLHQALREGNTKSFCEIVESEALTLHGLMMSSKPWFILMKANTLLIIEKIKNYRERTNYFLCFTLDAGPNIHLIYSQENELEIVKFIDQELKALCHQSKIIYDQIGDGPKKL